MLRAFVQQGGGSWATFYQRRLREDLKEKPAEANRKLHPEIDGLRGEKDGVEFDMVLPSG